MITELESKPELTREEKVEIIKGNPPHHIAIILDGNRRYARAHGETVPQAHQSGLENAVRMLKTLKELPINMVTLWGFSSDNWERPEQEVVPLMEIFAAGIGHYLPEVIADNARILHLGRTDRFEERSPALAQRLREAQEVTRENTGQTIVLALDFGGRDHEMRASDRRVAFALQAKALNPTLSDEKIRELITSKFTDFYDLEGQVSPADLIFRSSGEQRTSDIGYLNGRQTEFATSPKMWPEITENDLLDALVDFAKRERRQGK